MMKVHTLTDILTLQESSEVECKLAQGKDKKGSLPTSMWESYSAFANSSGGDIFLGVKELTNGSFDVAGIKKTQKVLDELWTGLNNRQKVSANILREKWVKVIDIKDKSIIHLHIPRASRTNRPLFVGSNPLKGCYQRFNSADVVMNEETVRRMMAEQVEDSRDIRIFKGFSIDELNSESIKSFRNMLSAHKTDHPWSELDNDELLVKLGCWRKDRETGEEGLTLAGLLMFGESPIITEVAPNYFLDYQELPDDPNEIRWLDRLIPDGTWSGNIFDFYRRIIRKLEENIKVPFSIKNNIRQDDTLTHQTIREALVNCLIHADYSDRASVKVVKSPKGFRFRNPGMMRVPVEIALEGGESDCRNRTLHKMFLLLGLGERAGSGLPKIKQGWTAQGHQLSLKDTNSPYNQTVMDLNWGGVTTLQVNSKATIPPSPNTPFVTSQIQRILNTLNEVQSRSEILNKLKLTDKVNFTEKYLQPALKGKFIEMTQPNSPNSPTQKYQLTSLGKMIAKMSKGNTL